MMKMKSWAMLSSCVVFGSGARLARKPHGRIRLDYFQILS
jgi:hypothetical protein